MGARALPNQHVRDKKKKEAPGFFLRLNSRGFSGEKNIVATPSGHWPESLLDELPIHNTVFVRRRYAADNVESIPASHKVVVTIEILQWRYQSAGTGPGDVIRGWCVQVIVSSGIALAD